MKLYPYQWREAVLGSAARNRETSMSASVWSCKGLAEHVGRRRLDCGFNIFLLTIYPNFPLSQFLLKLLKMNTHTKKKIKFSEQKSHRKSSEQWGIQSLEKNLKGTNSKFWRIVMQCTYFITKEKYITSGKHTKISIIVVIESKLAETMFSNKLTSLSGTSDTCA